jgi:hypothetical protein
VDRALVEPGECIGQGDGGGGTPNRRVNGGRRFHTGATVFAVEDDVWWPLVTRGRPCSSEEGGGGLASVQSKRRESKARGGASHRDRGGGGVLGKIQRGEMASGALDRQNTITGGTWRRKCARGGWCHAEEKKH